MTEKTYDAIVIGADHNGLTKDSLVMVRVKDGGWELVP